MSTDPRPVLLRRLKLAEGTEWCERSDCLQRRRGRAAFANHPANSLLGLVGVYNASELKVETSCQCSEPCVFTERLAVKVAELLLI